MMNDGERNETETERYDRNWSDIQQELRITQTGTQLLAGFLLTLPFQARFGMLTDFETGVYLALVLLAASVSVLALAPVSAHRLLFRQREMRTLVDIGNRTLIICMVASAILFAGTVLFIFEVVLHQPLGLVVGIVLFLATAGLWAAVPMRIRARRSEHRP
ncbi:MAG TPA: DUF6328 family protein [Microlunatus sp.]